MEKDIAGAVNRGGGEEVDKLLHCKLVVVLGRGRRDSPSEAIFYLKFLSVDI